ncbi:RNA ligase RtcB family protein [Endozoicomonadaceae bacterium StTr2]
MDNCVQALSLKANLVASSSSWIEGKAIQQLLTTAELEDMIRVSGMPDLHPGRGYPVGAAFFTSQRIYPALVGNDIGCGMGLWQTSLKTAKYRPEKLAAKLQHANLETPLDEQWQDRVSAGKNEKEIKTAVFDAALGSIGGGNHFAEFQQIDEIYDREQCLQAGIESGRLQLLVHSGSRGLGQHILQQHVTCFGHQGLVQDTPEFNDYISQHDEAVRWAELNRELIAERFLQAVRSDGSCLLDVTHNLVTPETVAEQTGWLHRKGATPASQGLVMIPGSRGDFSYLVQPVVSEISLYSLAHGAGRKWARGDCRNRLTGKYQQSELYKTRFGSQVICADKTLLYDEAPEAYKKCDDIIRDLEAAGLIRPVARFKPVVTYKTGNAGKAGKVGKPARHGGER